MNKRVDADPLVGSCEHGCRAATGPAIPRGDAGHGHDRVEGAQAGQEQAGKCDGIFANGWSPHHHGPELHSDAGAGLAGHPGAHTASDLSSLTVLIGGYAAASGELTMASGTVQSMAQDRGGVSITWGEAVFDAVGYGMGSTESFAAADTWLQVTGADLVLCRGFENSGSGAGQAWAYSEIDYMAIDIHSWSPPRPIVIELEHALAVQPPAADVDAFSDGSLNFAAVVAAAQAEGTDALALTSTQAFTDNQFSFVYAMALTAL